MANNSSNSSFFGLEAYPEEWPMPEKMTPQFKMGLSIYYSVLISISVLFNAVLIGTICAGRNLLTVTNILVMNLAIGDLLTSIFVVPFDIDLLLRGVFPFGKVMCGFSSIAFLLSLPSSVFCLLLLTIERFVSIVFPFHRIRYIRKRNTLIAIGIAWIYSLFFAIIPLFSKDEVVVIWMEQCHFLYSYEYLYLQLGLNFCSPVCMIVVMNLVLFRVASKHACDMKRRSLIGSNHKVRPSMIKLGANIKAAKTVLVLVFVFLVCWLTLILLTIFNSLCNICHPEYVTYLGNAINFSSIALNPILYGLRNSEIRRQFHKLKNNFLSLFCPYAKLPASDRSLMDSSSVYTTHYEVNSRKSSSAVTFITESET